jgi:hypothetical protein
MQNKVKVLVAAALVVALLMVYPVMAGPIIKMDRPQQDIYYDDEPILITGTNTGSNETYIIVRMAPGGELVNSGYAPVINGRWEYTIPSQTTSVHVTGKYNESDQNFYNLKLIRIGERPQITVTSEMAIETPTPSPTVDHSQKIKDLESRIAKQEETIGELVAEETITAAPTPAPTVTVNYSATIAALDERIAIEEAKNKEQDDLLAKIWKWLWSTE